MDLSYLQQRFIKFGFNRRSTQPVSLMQARDIRTIDGRKVKFRDVRSSATLGKQAGWNGGQSQKFSNESHSWIFLLINIILFITVSALAFKLNLPYLFYAEDGHYMMNLAKEDELWRGFEFGLSNNFLQSLAGIWFPMNTQFFPGYLVASLFKNHIALSQIIAYVIFSFEFFIIGLCISRMIGLSWNLALIAAWILPFIAYPYYYYPILYNITSLAPQIGTIIVASNLIIILFINLGRAGQRLSTSFAIAASIVLLSMFIVFTIPVDVSLCAPIMMIICGTYLLFCKSTSEQRAKILFSIAILFCLIASGAPFYIYGLLKYSVSYYLPNELRNGVQTIDWSVISILFHGKGKGESWLFIFGSLGTIFFSFYGKNFYRSIARGVLAAQLVIVGFGMLLVKVNLWSGPVPIYYEFLLWPFYVAYSVAIIGLFFNFLFKRIFGILNLYLDNILLRSFILMAPCSIFLFPTPVGDVWNIPNPPVKTAIVETLAQEISLIPGTQFRGRAANFTGQNLSGPINRGGQAANDNSILWKTGNDHRMNGLWFYNIPTLDTCTQLISPPYFQLAHAFFSLPEDQQERGSITLRKPNPRWLAAWGVKYIITDAPMKGMIERQTISLVDAGRLYLYEVAETNVGQYSPTETIKMIDSNKIIESLQKQQFDPRNQVISNIELPHKLVPASNSKIIVNKGFFTISAVSKGDSIILLPFEYSHCLSLKSNAGGKSKPILFRANLTQTGILFNQELNASIRYFTGPFNNATCRLKDAKDFEKSAHYEV